MRYLTTLGRNGGRTFRCSSASQSMSLKNGWVRIWFSPSTQPNRLAAFFVMNPGNTQSFRKLDTGIEVHMVNGKN